MPPKNRGARNAQKTKPNRKPTFQPGSFEEVEHLLKHQVALAEALEKLPDSFQFQEQAKDNMVLLRKAMHTWGEKHEFLDTRPAEPRALSDQEVLAFRRTRDALDAQIRWATANSINGKVPIELLKDNPS
jgi:hypothetical protein